MNQVIWKWPLEIVDRQIVSMPTDALILCAREQNGKPTLWARCSPDALRRDRIILMFGTGHPLPPDPGCYLGTCCCSGSLVWHVFEAFS